MELSENQKKAFLDRVNFYTAPTLPHEQGIIDAIIGMKTDGDNWRFLKGVSCQCGRTLSNLDYFLSALRYHGTDFIKSFANLPDQEGVKIEVVDHHISVQCLNCGRLDEEIHPEMTCTKPGCASYIYRHPGPVSQSVRMSQLWFDRILDDLRRVQFS